MSSGLRRLAAVAVLLVVAAACTGESGRDLPDVALGSAGEGSASVAPSSPVVAPTASGRLAVIDGSGNLLTLGPDGSDAVVLAESEEGAVAVRQPAWSPDGTRVAWVRIRGGAEPSAAVVTANPDGTGSTEAATSVAPFYLFWDPTSSRIAYLGSSSPSEIELGLVEADGGDARPLDAGQPLYFSWAPSGEQMLVHVGADRLDRLALDGSLTEVGDRPGTFSSPAWSPDGRTLLYAAAGRARQGLVARDLERDRVRRLVRFDGSISFVLSPDGSRAAFQIIDGQSVRPLSVVELSTGEVRPVGVAFAVAFFWSPEGDRLLYLAPEAAEERIWFRWGVWDGESSFATPRFVPTAVFAQEYLPFFDQYAQSMSLWSPDGTAFAYAGVDEQGQAGIWVQAAEEGATPVLVTDGVFVTWSPA